MVKIMISLIIGGNCVVFFSRSPFFGIFGVLVQALSFACLLCLYACPFFGLLLILVYIGGMLIIFLFSTILSAERYPESGWKETLLFWVGLCVITLPVVFSWEAMLGLMSKEENGDHSYLLGNVLVEFSFFTIVVVVILLVALVIVLKFCFEHSQSALRKL
uniref:NADH-ubiquinone oxidoreductase chain 6 n=1 Tax=Amphiura digitula TaxID=2588555 RepID=A0A4Y5T133_9ECHI|nr:NADH dehydrogenase subunit 6 [Amphiura digitula]QDA81585.1 NADH dehydrogenase subunit 6 [Amphiura digitula]QHT54243.1 NADH dehydrogenase subunit 6 [Amphiura digitula]